MKLKMTVDNIEGLDDNVQKLYSKGDDGKFYLDLDGYDATAQAKVKEFRQTNIDLMKERDELAKKFSGIDLDKYNEMVEKERQMKDKELLDKGQIEDYVAQRTERMRQDYDSKIESLQTIKDKLEKELGESQNQLSRVLIDSEIQKSVSSIGALKKNAMMHILNVGRQQWKLESNEPVARTPDGKMIYGKDGSNPITFDEWAETLVKDFPYLFENPEGSQSKGSPDRHPNMSGKTSEQLMDLAPEARLGMIFSGNLKKKAS